MLFYGTLFISFFLVALVIRLKKNVFFALAEGSVGLVNELIADVDDEEKIKLVQKGTNKLVVSLLKVFGLIVLAFGIGSIPLVIYGWLTQTPYENMVFSSFYSILAISIGASIPFFLPIGPKNPSAYSEVSQLLHRLGLNNYNISNKLFKAETKKIRKRNLKRRSDFVIISGLARAGTTSLMNKLSDIEDFVSLSYANMPFLMAPNYWAKLYKPKTKELKERSHKDGVMIGLESAEALEEYFFKVKSNDSYISEISLSEYELAEKDYNDYLDYQAIIKLDDHKVYLAKNNNFMLRYNSVRKFNEDFVMVILYRDPLTHAASLLEKHKDYLKLQQEDPFVLEYMDWLGHHEFGTHQKQFVFDTSEKEINDDKLSLDYWLKVWINYYGYALSIDHPNTLFINYDEFCKNPGSTLEDILSKTKIETSLPVYEPFVNKRKSDHQFSAEVKAKAQEIYGQLNSKASVN